MRHLYTKIKKFFKNLLVNPKLMLNIFLVIVFLVAVFYSNSTLSSPLQNLSGYLWGANQVGTDEPGGVGWVSMNCTSGGNCGVADYGVNIDTDGYLRGYAWSENYGWLKFGELSNFPSGGGTTSDNARLVGNNVVGWARFCAAAASPENCTGFVPNLRNGGWDGWLSLSGSSPNYGVTLSGNAFSGYAWGGDDGGRNVVGWVDFANAIYTPVVAPTVTISASPAVLPSGGSTTLTWTGVNITPGVDACTATGDWSGTKSYPMPQGGETIGPLSAGTYTYSIQCGSSNISTVQVTVGSSNALAFYADPSPVYPPYQTTLYWNSIPAGLNSCVADSAPPLNVATVQSWNGPVPDPNSSQPVSAPFNPTNFKITCLDTLGQPVSSTISVPQGSLPETVSLSSNGVVEAPPNSGNFFTTLSWSTINANNCVAGGAWSGNKPNSGAEPNVPVTATPPAFDTFSLTCTGIYSGEVITASVNLNADSNRTFSTVRPKYVEQ